jgi:hypothetical protein
MNACVIIYNIINKSEHDAPSDNDHPFDIQGPLVEVEQVPTQFVTFLHMN